MEGNKKKKKERNFYKFYCLIQFLEWGNRRIESKNFLHSIFFLSNIIGEIWIEGKRDLKYLNREKR